MIRKIFIAAALALAVTLPAIPAQALVARTFLSAAGSDSNNCANVLTPCRHLATAYAATAPDGEIYVLDPANYGSVTITGPVSIEGHGWASIAPASGTPAITINANSGDKINIIGVVLDGTNLTGTTGIQFNSGGSLTVRDSVIRNFTSVGINFVPNTSSLSHLYVSNTLISDSGSGDGININPAGTGTTNGILNHVEIQNNYNTGLFVNTSTQTTNVTVSDSVVANNGSGIVISGSATTMFLMVRNSTIANNGGDGLQAIGPYTTLAVTRSTITGNATGWAGNVATYTDNNIDGNGSANSSPGSTGMYR